MLAEKIRIQKDIIQERLGKPQDKLNNRQMKSLLLGKKKDNHINTFYIYISLYSNTDVWSSSR